MGDTNAAPVPIPVPYPTELSSGILLLRPLSRKGNGPGLIVLAHNPKTSNTNSGTSSSLAIEDGVPSPLIKWAEEGYTVVEIQEQAFGDGKENPLQLAVEELSRCEQCQPQDGPIGLISYDPRVWNLAAPSLASLPTIWGAVIYSDVSKAASLTYVPSVSILQHLAGPAKSTPESKGVKVYNYPTAASALFATPFQKDFHYANEAVSHTRNLTFLKKLMNGPYFDLEAIWEEHTYYEFENRSVPHTMATMVQEPYVNHIPTLTGGIGRDRLTDFYRNHFIWNNPEDAELELISRTVGIDRVIDEFIYKITHNLVVDWLLPGIPPTNRKLEIPMTAVVNIRGDRLYHEHIAWDQTTALVQMDLLPEYLPYPYALPNAEGRKFEYRVPAAGRETAEKMRDKNSVASNGMFGFGIREVKINSK